MDIYTVLIYQEMEYMAYKGQDHEHCVGRWSAIVEIHQQVMKNLHNK